jgi:lipid II:glycine glycyltransferase (peptidoglycan interpeptide bridge formation enzyme)
MSIEIKEIIDEKAWQEYEEKNSPHTFLQTWEWGAAQELLGHKIFRLGIYDRGKGFMEYGSPDDRAAVKEGGEPTDNLSGAAFVYKINARRGSFLFCPHGPSINWNRPEYFRALAEYLRELGKKEKASFLRVSPLAPNTEKTAALFAELGFISAPVHMMHPEHAWILDIAGSEEEIMAGMKKRTRYSIRKAEKDGIKIKISDRPEDVSLFYSMYLETARRQKFVPFSEDYIRREFEIFKKRDKALMFFSYHADKLLSAAVIIFSGSMAFYHHGASIRMEKSGLTASELLQWKVIIEARIRGAKYYNFWGIAPENGRPHPWRGLSTFKKGFGGQEEDYLHARDLVFSPKYWLNYAVETVRRIKRGY